MRAKISAILLLACACGPSPLPSSESESESDGDSSTDDPSTTGTPAETEDSTETSTETSTDATDFVPNTDDILPSECNAFEQDCPEGEKCVPYASNGGTWDAHKCVPLMGDQLPGEPCVYGGAVEATDDCDATSMCWYVTEVDGELLGECVPFCMGSFEQPECPEGSFCPITGDGVLNICIPTCDPVAQDCDEGLACYWAGAEFACVDATQNLPLGEPCGFINDCAAGLTCMSVDYLPDCNGSSCCAAWCDLQLGDAQCEATPGSSCVPFFEVGRAPPEYDHVGVCVVP